MTTDDLDLPSTHSGPTRREVLSWSSAAALGSLATPGLVSRTLAQTGRSGVEPMSIGYVAGSDLLPALSDLSWEGASLSDGRGIEVLPAVSIETELRPYPAARVRVAGLYPHAEALGNIGLLMTVLMPTDGGTAPFYPWGVRAGAVRQVSPPIAFEVPLLADGGLELTLEVEDRGGKGVPGGRAKATSLRTFGTRFTSSGEKGVPRLRRGLYLLGTRWGMWETPTLLPPAGEAPRLDLVSVVIAVEPILDPFAP